MGGGECMKVKVLWGIHFEFCIRGHLKITSSRHKGLGSGEVSEKMILDNVGEGGVFQKMMHDAESEG